MSTKPRRRLLEFLIDATRKAKQIAGYGAPGKGNTLLIRPPDRISETRPDYVPILPWNLQEEIMAQLACIRTWGRQFLVGIPDVQVHP